MKSFRASLCGGQEQSEFRGRKGAHHRDAVREMEGEGCGSPQPYAATELLKCGYNPLHFKDSKWKQECELSQFLH